MPSALGDLPMSDELPSGDRAIYVFLEMVALVCVFEAGDSIRDGRAWWRSILWLGLAVFVFTIAIKWSKIKLWSQSQRKKGLILIATLLAFSGPWLYGLISNAFKNRSHVNTVAAPETPFRSENEPQTKNKSEPPVRTKQTRYRHIEQSRANIPKTGPSTENPTFFLNDSLGIHCPSNPDLVLTSMQFDKEEWFTKNGISVGTLPSYFQDIFLEVSSELSNLMRLATSFGPFRRFNLAHLGTL
jgi:hypothetical protein